MDFSNVIQAKLKNADRCLCISFYETCNFIDFVFYSFVFNFCHFMQSSVLCMAQSHEEIYLYNKLLP